MSKMLKNIILFCLIAGFGSAWADPAIVPVTVNAQVTPEPGKMVMVTVYMTAQTEIANGSLEIYPPEGATIYEGQARWTGNLSKGRTIKLVNWYDVSKLREANAPAWKLFTRGNMDGLLRARMQQIKLSSAQLSRLFGTGKVVSQNAYR